MAKGIRVGSTCASGNRVGIDERVRAFKMFVEGMQLKEIAKTIGCHVNTIQHFRKEDEWDARLDRLFTVVVHEVELDFGKSLRESLEIIQTFKSKMLSRVKAMPAHTMPVQMLSSFRDMHDLEQELIGQLQAAAASGELALYTDEQLEAMVRGEEPEGEGSGGAGPSAPDAV